MRILHAANYNFDKDGARYFGWDHKVHQGLVQAGHYVYPFSISDRARMLSPLCSRTGGLWATNRKFIKCVENLRPDLLVLGHSAHLSEKTIQHVRESFPQMKICLYYGDAIWSGRRVDYLQAKLPFVDAVCISTGGELLRPYCGPGRPAAFIPNSVEPSIECHRAFECPTPDYDLVFFGTDKNLPERRKFLEDLRAGLPEFRFGFFGCMDQRSVFGFERDIIMSRSRMALNLSRRNDVAMCSSDRIAHTTGNGLLTLNFQDGGLESLYGPEEIVYFQNIDDLIAKCRAYSQNDTDWRHIAKNGWERAHRDYSSREVARFMVNLTFRDPAWREAAWSDHIFWPAEERTSRAAA
ncbi:glycosyltransferase family protein [Planctomicrobium piriforme]|uniref:Glycosyl transferases group 1 n=1 Tax=Planctomicrobium piriforme TaxID=1576369 RepID=A0A1I3C4X8_9PLAN|nr:glycosyltransferase [Planctomicrobium piriforme]SFH69229.1 Glycosyl transferases group 1 [Planctomicrobium piriforme]